MSMRFSLEALPPAMRAQAEAKLRAGATIRTLTPMAESDYDKSVAVRNTKPPNNRRLKSNVENLHFVSHGLPAPIPEFRFHPIRRWRFDFAWPDQKIAVEVEGGIWTQGRHTRGAGFLKDAEKYNTATLMAWRIFRVTPRGLKSGRAAELVKAAMRNGGMA